MDIWAVLFTLLAGSVLGLIGGLYWDNWGWRSDPEGSIKILTRVQKERALKERHKQELKDLEG